MGRNGHEISPICGRYLLKLSYSFLNDGKRLADDLSDMAVKMAKTS